MREGVRCEPGLVVLPSDVWRVELEAELARAGHKQPGVAAVKVLQRIVARAAGWPREPYMVAPSGSPTHEAPAP